MLNIFNFRNLLNCTAMDIMYYTSPLFRMEIWSALQFELNRLYQMFTQRNPTFEANGGKVSIVTHSLGNIIITAHIWYTVVASLNVQYCSNYPGHVFQAVLLHTTCYLAGHRMWNTRGVAVRCPAHPAPQGAGDTFLILPNLLNQQSVVYCSE